MCQVPFSELYTCLMYSFPKPRASFYYDTILQMRELRHRESKYLAQDLTARRSLWNIREAVWLLRPGSLPVCYRTFLLIFVIVNLWVCFSFKVAAWFLELDVTFLSYAVYDERWVHPQHWETTISWETTEKWSGGISISLLVGCNKATILGWSSNIWLSLFQLEFRAPIQPNFGPENSCPPSSAWVRNCTFPLTQEGDEGRAMLDEKDEGRTSPRPRHRGTVPSIWVRCEYSSLWRFWSLMLLFSQYIWLGSCYHSHHHGLMSTEHFFPDKSNFLGEENAQTKHTWKFLHINNPDKQISLLIETFCFMFVLSIVAYSVSPALFFF